MHKDDLYAYWLNVTGTAEEQESIFHLLKEKEVIDQYLEPNGPESSPYSSYQYPEKHGAGSEWNEEEMEEILHSIAIKLPGVVLEIEGENTDDHAYGFIKRFHGNMFQERKLVTSMPPLIADADIPFDQRYTMRGMRPEPITSAMTIYEQMSNILHEQPDAYYIARNLMYLTNNVEPNEEIPINMLYKLAERMENISAAGFTQPFLNEERLDAIRVLLENGLRSEYDAKLGDLSPKQTLEFLLTCSDDAFIFAVEETAASNQEKYAAEGFDERGAKAFERALSDFISDHSSIAPQIFPHMDYVSVADTATGWPAPEIPDHGYIKGFLRGYNVEFRHRETGELNYNSAAFVPGTIEEYHQHMLDSWGQSGYVPFEVERANGFEPTGRVVFRGYYTEHYDPDEHETYVESADAQISKLLADNHYVLKPGSDPHNALFENVQPSPLADRIADAAKRIAAVTEKGYKTPEIEY